MTLKRSSLAVLCAVTGLWSSTGQAQSYPVFGNARFQVGVGLPIPIILTPVPNGGVVAVPGAVVQQTAGPDPKRITIPPGRLTAPGTPMAAIPLFLANSAVFSVQTSIAVSFPRQQATLRAGGRTGAPTVTFCGGPFATPTGNPLCTGPAWSGYGGGIVHGLMRYTKTLNQFGGPAQAALGGGGRMALRAAAAPPCSFLTTACLVVSNLLTPPPTDALGGPFGFFVTTPGVAASPGLFNARVTALGLVTYRTATGLGPGVANPLTSVGGPWTTGRITLSVTQNIGPSPQIFLLTGSDNRVNGVGAISLVSAALTQRTLTGPEAKRGWLNLTISAPPQKVPSLTRSGVAALALALLGIAFWRSRHASGARSPSG